MKLESCQKLGRNLDVFLALGNWGGGRGRTFQKLYTRYHPCLAENFREDTHTSPEVIEAQTLNFKPNIKFSGLIFLGGTRPSLGVR